MPVLNDNSYYVVYLQKAVHGCQGPGSCLQEHPPSECVAPGFLRLEFSAGLGERVPPEQEHSGKETFDHGGSQGHDGSYDGPPGLGPLLGQSGVLGSGHRPEQVLSNVEHDFAPGMKKGSAVVNMFSFLSICVFPFAKRKSQ